MANFRVAKSARIYTVVNGALVKIQPEAYIKPGTLVGGKLVNLTYTTDAGNNFWTFLSIGDNRYILKTDLMPVSKSSSFVGDDQFDRMVGEIPSANEAGYTNVTLSPDEYRGIMWKDGTDPLDGNFNFSGMPLMKHHNFAVKKDGLPNFVVNATTHKPEQSGVTYKKGDIIAGKFYGVVKVKKSNGKIGIMPVIKLDDGSYVNRLHLHQLHDGMMAPAKKDDATKKSGTSNASGEELEMVRGDYSLASGETVETGTTTYGPYMSAEGENLEMIRGAYSLASGEEVRVFRLTKNTNIYYGNGPVVTSGSGTVYMTNKILPAGTIIRGTSASRSVVDPSGVIALANTNIPFINIYFKDKQSFEQMIPFKNVQEVFPVNNVRTNTPGVSSNASGEEMEMIRGGYSNCCGQ